MLLRIERFGAEKDIVIRVSICGEEFF